MTSAGQSTGSPKPPRILGRCDALWLPLQGTGYVYCDAPATHTRYGHLLCPACFEMTDGGRVLGPGRVQAAIVQQEEGTTG